MTHQTPAQQGHPMPHQNGAQTFTLPQLHAAAGSLIAHLQRDGLHTPELEGQIDSVVTDLVNALQGTAPWLAELRPQQPQQRRTREVYFAPRQPIRVIVTEWRGAGAFRREKEYRPGLASLRRLQQVLADCPPVDGVQQPVVGIHPYGPTLSYLIRQEGGQQ